MSHSSVYAETDCGAVDVPYYTGVLDPPSDSYDIYVKLGKVGQTGSVEAYALSENEVHCRAVGATEASSSEWRKIGTYEHKADTSVLFQLSSPLLEDLPDANRPSIMLVSHTDPVCIPTTECTVTIAGQAAYIRPAGTSLEDNSLRIVRVSPTNPEYITKVEYYADNELLYQTKDLQDVKMDKVPYYAHQIIRVAYYSSGQTAVMVSKVPNEGRYGFWQVARPYLSKYSNTFVLMGIMVFVIVLVRAYNTIVGHMRASKQWRIDHGFMRTNAERAVTPAQIRTLRWRERAKQVYQYVEKAIIVVSVIAGLVFVTNAFFFQIGTVSGESMYATLKNGQHIFINKIPITFARLNNTQYIPTRGAIVVASPNFGIVDTSIQQDGQSLIVKRVCGLPGERVVVDHGKYSVYNSAHPEGFDPNEGAPWMANIQPDDSGRRIDVQLAENELFLCGDNYPVSIDSRYNGPIGTGQVVGVVTWP